MGRILDEQIGWWHSHKASIGLLPDFEAQVILHRYGIGVRPHDTKELTKKFNVSAPTIHKALKQARVRADLEALILQGKAMQLVSNRPLGSEPLKPILGSWAGLFIFSLARQEIHTLNSLLYKSESWLLGVGMSAGSVKKIQNVFNGTGLYLRGEVPADKSERTPWPHTVR